jgi:hypothetical protein
LTSQTTNAFPVAGDQVELTELAAPVSVEQRHSFGLQVAGCHLLAVGAHGLALLLCRSHPDHLQPWTLRYTAMTGRS